MHYFGKSFRVQGSSIYNDFNPLFVYNLDRLKKPVQGSRLVAWVLVLGHSLGVIGKILPQLDLPTEIPSVDNLPSRRDSRLL
jgi:hypothetical protein